MRLIDADKLQVDTWEKCYSCDGNVHTILGYSVAQIEKAPTIAPPPNNPLTLEELRDMDGEIVYVTPINDWAKVVKYGLLYFGTADYNTWDEGIGKTYGNTWLAYRRKPEEGTTVE